jgi:hypothetical protein
MSNFRQALQTQRWDDHRYYHHVSAVSFLCAYALLLISPAAAALVAWLVAMTSRQAGHFFFEPKGYDKVNQATHEHKEAIKVGYNLRRKVVLLAIWALSPLALVADPALFGIFEPHTSLAGFLEHVGMIWLVVGVGGLLFRTLHLCFLKDVQTGLVWCTKIVTDPYNDIRLYHKAPLHLLRGERPSAARLPH